MRPSSRLDSPCRSLGGKGPQLACRTQGSGGRIDPESLGEPAPSLRRDEHGSRVADTADPAELEAARGKCDADRAGKVRASLAPIEARPAERTARPGPLVQIDAEASKELFS